MCIHDLNLAEIVDMAPSPRHSTRPAGSAVMTAWDHLLESPKHSGPRSSTLTAWDHLMQSPKSSPPLKAKSSSQPAGDNQLTDFPECSVPAEHFANFMMAKVDNRSVLERHERKAAAPRHALRSVPVPTAESINIQLRAALCKCQGDRTRLRTALKVEQKEKEQLREELSTSAARLVAVEAELQSMKGQLNCRQPSLALETVTTLAQTAAAARPRVQQAVQAESLKLAKSLARRWTLQVRLRQIQRTIGLSAFHRNMDTRECVMKELVTVQRDFCGQLEGLRSGYLRPIQLYSAQRCGTSLDPHGWLHQEFEILHTATSELLERHTAALVPLIKATDDESQLAVAFELIFAAQPSMSRFLNRLAPVRTFVARETKRNPELANTMETQKRLIDERMQSKVPSFASLLFKILQQAVNYGALLQRMIDLSSAQHVSGPMLQQLVSRVNKLNQVVDASAQNYKTIRELQCSLPEFPICLVSDERRITDEITAELIRDEMAVPVKLVLMTDYLLVLEPTDKQSDSTTNASAVNSSKIRKSVKKVQQFGVVALLAISTDWQPDALRAVDQRVAEFVVQTNKDAFTIRTVDDVTKDRWVQLVNGS